MKMKKLLIFMGPAGVGKTKLVEYVKNNHPQALVINKKEIELTYPKSTKEEQNSIYHHNINDMLKIGDYVIVNSNYVRKQDRYNLFKSIHNFNDLYIIGIWVENN